jgi:hypothetical protein
MSRARDMANIAASVAEGGLAGKNFFHNPSFNIWQRGTSFTTNNSRICTSDRWFVFTGLNVAGTHTRQSSGLKEAPYCLRVQRDSGNTAVASVLAVQTMTSEDSGSLIGKTVTISFTARKGANFSGSSDGLQVYKVTGTGTDQGTLSWINGGWTSQANTLIDTVTLTSDFQTFSVTTDITSSANQVAIYFHYVSSGTAGANDYFDITKCKVELGDKATTFIPSTFAEDMKTCERFYEKTYPYSIAPATTATYDTVIGHRINGLNNTGSEQKYFVTKLRTEKRGTPTNTYHDAEGRTGKLTVFNGGGTGTHNNSIGLSITSTSMVGFGPSNGTQSGISCFITTDSELN